MSGNKAIYTLTFSGINATCAHLTAAELLKATYDACHAGRLALVGDWLAPPQSPRPIISPTYNSGLGISACVYIIFDVAETLWQKSDQGITKLQAPNSRLSILVTSPFSLLL